VQANPRKTEKKNPLLSFPALRTTSPKSGSSSAMPLSPHLANQSVHFAHAVIHLRRNGRLVHLGYLARILVRHDALSRKPETIKQND
jgi:hypothetical protein